jgi:dTDP-4-amino-4,6-dideoxygalactose transaminase
LNVAPRLFGLHRPDAYPTIRQAWPGDASAHNDSPRLANQSGVAPGGSKMRIPFNRPLVAKGAFAYLEQAIANRHLSGDGPFTKKCQQLLEDLLGVPRVLLTTSCTDALELAALLLNIQPGDEVIVPSFTFVSTANAFVLRGARPVFCDVRPDTFNMDENSLEQLISERTRAIVPVHYAGVGCEMDPIMTIANRHDIAVVEDNAHGLMGRYRGRHLGTFGALATLSFHETKNFTCGEGGAIVINDNAWMDRAEVLREKGTNRSRYFRGQIDKYTWVDLGSSFLPADVLATLLLAQLESREEIQARRRALWHRYADGLAAWAKEEGVQIPFVPLHCEQAYHMFYLVMPTLDARQALIAHLRALGINSVFHYLPLHLSPMGRAFGGREGDCPVTEAVSERLVRLPFYFDLTDSELTSVVEVIQTFRHARSSGYGPGDDTCQTRRTPRAA